MKNKHNIHPQHLKRINEVLEIIGTWKEFKYTDFAYQPELDMPELPAFKVYLKADHEVYFWFHWTVPLIHVKYSPTDSWDRPFDEYKFQHKNQGGANTWQQTLNILDHWRKMILEHRAEEDKHARLKSEMNLDFEEFINAGYWESNEPVEEERRPFFIDQLNKAKSKIADLDDGEFAPEVKAYYAFIINQTIININNGAPRSVIKEHLIALVYAVVYGIADHSFHLAEIVKELATGFVHYLGIKMGLIPG